jgi:hypothetical protein
MANTGVKSITMVQEMVMMLAFFPSWVVTRTTGPDSIRVKALFSFNWRMAAPPIFMPSAKPTRQNRHGAKR